MFGFTDQLDAASNNEPVPAVRDAEWKAFQRLLPAGSPHELVDWANRFGRNQKYEKQVAVLSAAINKKQDAASIAQEQQTIGDIYVSHLHQPEKAIPLFTQALSYWQNNNARSSTVVVLVQQLMNAYLSTRQYANAIAFAQSQLKIDRAREEELWAPLSNAATQLMHGTPEDQTAGRTLIEGALAMDPPLNPGYQQALRDLLNSPMQP